MTRLKIGIAGCGLVTQVEHLPNIVGLPELFALAGIADPSAKVRTALSARYGVAAFATAGELMSQGLDCLLVATPDSYHADLVIAGLEHGLPVFSEKPLCYDAADARRIVAAREKARKIVQVGYMKRFDPAYRALGALLAAHKAPLRAITVDVIDPDHQPFTDHHDLVTPDDIPDGLIRENAERRRSQVLAALGFAPDDETFRGFSGPMSSSLVHDLNLVQGLLDTIGVRIAEPKSAAFVNGDGGVTLTATLQPNDAVLAMTWVAAPKLAYYCERISLVFDDRNYELRFPSPYLNHHPTALIERRANGLALEEINHRPSYAEPFVEELKGFHAAITEGAPVVNTVEQAGIDMTWFAQFTRLAAGR